VSDTRRMVLGAVVAAVVVGYGAAHQFGVAWGVVLAVCALMFVAAVAVLGDQLGRRRASGN
jgi:predicted membrane-bound mannosyltransferase